MNEINREYMVNGDFATGDFEGWTITDPKYYSLMEYETGKHCAVIDITPMRQSLSQSFMARPGTYQFYVRHRATDESGQPMDRKTLTTGNVSYTASTGTIHTRPVFFFSDGDWQKTIVEFSVGQLDQESEVIVKLWNAYRGVPGTAAPWPGDDYVRSPIAVTNIGFWKVA